jgi:hypothetical protein
MTQNEGHAARKKAGYEKAEGGIPEVCPQCGRPLKGAGLEEFLGRFGITDEVLSNVSGQLENVGIEEYLNTARECLKQSVDNVRLYVKENPAKAAVAVAVLALGASLVWSSAQQAPTEEIEDRFRQLELNRALAGPRHRLDEVLSELGVAV